MRAVDDRHGHPHRRRLTAAAYFDRATKDESEIRAARRALYRRIDWRWAQNGAATVSHGWKPETGFLRYRWQGYNEALLLYMLGLGSPTHPLPVKSYTRGRRRIAGRGSTVTSCCTAGPLFMHQLSHVWMDFRGIQDDFMRGKRIDYFENSRRVTLRAASSTRFAIREDSRATASTAGASPRATVPVRRRAAWRA